MCQTCDHLKAAIKRAESEGNKEKRRVMRVIYANHRKNMHPPKTFTWPNGTKWTLAEEGD